MPVTQYLNPIHTITTRWRRRIVFVVVVKQINTVFHPLVHFLFNRYLSVPKITHRRETSLSFSHTFCPLLSLSLSRSFNGNCKKCKENFFSLRFIWIERVVWRTERILVFLVRQKKKKTLLFRPKQGNLRFHPMYFLNAPFTDRIARWIVYRWRWNWPVSTSGAKRNNFPVAWALPCSKCETRGVSVVYTPL